MSKINNNLSEECSISVLGQHEIILQSILLGKIIRKIEISIYILVTLQKLTPICIKILNSMAPVHNLHGAFVENNYNISGSSDYSGI